ncbi:MAG TPA: PVC-type heme-binding CxxCH protein, partial [Pirellulales bacterium]|nr:PVC-type heme-binding CxxCH protein [Pirellulales bacterium]
VLGPDHKWWMSHGDGGFDVTGTDGSHIKFQWGAMLRGELDGSQLETVAVNFRNPYELCVSSFGEAFCSDNDNDGNFSARICWLMEGGDYGWFGHPPQKVPPGTPFGEHWHFRGHVPGFVPATLVTGFGSPCGICFYEGDAFGPEYKNAPLHCDPGPREVRIYRHQPAGYGMKATSRVLITSDGDNYFRPDDVCAAPDGSLYLSDWYDGGVGGHAYNDPDRGRIFLLRPTGDKPRRVGKPGPYANLPDAMEGLKSPNLATQYLARERLLAEGQASLPALKAMLADAEPNYRARALWLLDRIGGEARKPVIAQLQNSDAGLRALAVRILRRHGDENADALLAMAGDPSAEVRREVLLALPKLNGPKAEAALAQLAAAYDGHDRYQLEAIHIAAGQRKAELYAALEAAGKASLDKIQLLQVLDSKRAADLLAQGLAATNLDEAARATLVKQLGGSTSSEAGLAVVKLIGDERTAGDLRGLALNLLASNLSGNWKPLRDRPELAAAVRKLLGQPAWQLAALRLVGDDHLAQFSGDVLALAADQKANAEARQKAVEVAAALRAEGAPQTLEKLLHSREASLRQAALAALVELQAWPAVKQVLSDPDTPADIKRRTIDRLIDSGAGALVLLRWIDAKVLPDALRARAIAKAANHPDSNIRVLYEKFIPESQRPKRLGAAVKPADILAMKGDARRGEQIFSQSTAAQCKACHRVGNVGGAVGPDLSQIGKKYERATLLETILDPSKAIAPEYVPYLVETEQGQVYVGFVVEKNDDRLVLKDAKGQLITIAAGDVAALEAQTKSIMPELVLRDVTAQDAADLLAYLTSLKEGVLPVTRFRVLGPFRQPGQRGIDHDFGPEKHLPQPDLNASYPGADGRPCRWELVEANTALGFAAVDQVAYAHRRKLPAEGVTNYFLVFAESDSDQAAQLLLGSDDSCNVWLNGELVHQYRGSRAVGQADDRLKVRLRGGRNVMVIKVENHQGPGGLALSIAAAANVQVKTE